MSIDLRILGIRKLRSVEAALLAGKPSYEIMASALFRQLFPAAPAQAGYQLLPRYTASLDSIKHMITPIVTEEDDAEYDEVSYIYWEEELGYYWRNLSHEDPLIDEILTAVRGYVHYDQDYSVVPYELVCQYFNRHQPTCPEEVHFCR